MNSLIVSTKKTATTYKIANLISSFISIALGFFVFAVYSVMTQKYGDDNKTVIVLILGLIAFAEGMITMIRTVLYAQSYLDVYSDRFVGKGVQNFSVLTFNFKPEEINNISVEKGSWLHIQTISGTYKIITNKDTATKVFDYYISLKG